MIIRLQGRKKKNLLHGLAPQTDDTIFVRRKRRKQFPPEETNLMSRIMQNNPASILQRFAH